MEILQAILNNKIYRFVLGIIVMCLIGSPAVNGFTENQIWLHAALVWIIFVILSCFTRFKFTYKTNWIIFVLIAGIAILVIALSHKFA